MEVTVLIQDILMSEQEALTYRNSHADTFALTRDCHPSKTSKQETPGGSFDAIKRTFARQANALG